MADTGRGQTVHASVERFRVLEPILRCPATQTGLRLVSRSELVALLPNDERERVSAETSGAFISERGRLGYPIMGSVVSFLDRDTLHIDGTLRQTQDGDSGSEVIKQSVQDWYDHFGWQKNGTGAYNDSALFSTTATSGNALYEMQSHLALLDRLPGGNFLLDAASGAIAHPEYMAYSWRYALRICVDRSLAALREAAEKTGDHGCCVMADITRLPFMDDTIDGIVSGYTVQHIPESEQELAVRELFRVLRPAGHMCVMTEVQPTERHRWIVLAFRILHKVMKVLRLAPRYQAPVHADTSTESPALYFVAHSAAWWRSLARTLSPAYSVDCLRSLRKEEYERVFGRAEATARFVRALETMFSQWIADASAYCLIRVSKPTSD